VEAKELTQENQETYNEILNVFAEKTVEVLKKQIDIEVSHSNTKHSCEELPQSCEVESQVFFQSNAVKVRISLSFPEETILNIVSCIFDEDRTEIDEEILETCGEFLNIIFGAAKTVLNDEKGYNTKIAIPKVGKQQSKDQDNSLMDFHTFDSEAGPFFLEFNRGE